ncbi:MAG: VCBS repeat-containing protein [Bdellovibrionales bacterium]|nr:VCBS repeat-containing protein [Bdellovibrionales bacterium]
MGRITINSNIAALNAERRLGQSTRSLQESFARLSSGLRITKASDDAAGLAIFSSLHLENRVYAQGVRNINDGISMMAIADGALEELTAITIRQIELSEQAANGALSSVQRQALEEEANSLVDEHNRILAVTSFNGIDILADLSQEIRIQGGFGDNGAINVVLGSQTTVGDGTFAASVSYEANNAPRWADLGDVNGDGKLDIVSSNYADDELSILLGNGDGSFRGPTTLATGTSPKGWFSDVNADGNLDIVNTDVGDNTVGVFLGNGDGSFKSRSTFATGAAPQFVAFDYINADSALDMVVVDRTSNTVSVLFGNGDGSFLARASYDVGSSPREVGIADFNGDSVLDLISVGASPDTVSVLLGNSNGTFKAANDYDTGTDPYELALGDLNGDAILDVVTPDQTGGTLSILLGNSNGSFRASVSIAVGSDPRSVALADFNGDNVLDIVNDNGDDNTITVLIGRGDGTFDAPYTYLTGTDVRQVIVADLNGDNVADLITSDRGDDAIGVFLGNTTTSGLASITQQYLSYSSHASARNELDALADHLDQISNVRGAVGSFQSRLQTSFGNLTVTRENFSSAESRIRDVDVAQEAARLVRAQILQQAGAAVLSQANQSPALALVLLG